MALRELLVSFDVETGQATAKLANLSRHVEEQKSKLGELAAAFLESRLVEGLGEFVKGQIEAAKESRLMAQKLGTSVDQLEEFDFAAENFGVSSEGAATALKFLNKNVGLALENNPEAAQTFAKLGVAIKDGGGNVRELGDMLPEVADAFAKMGSQQERTSAAMKIFGRQGADLIPLLMGGAKGLEEMSAEFKELGGGMSEDFIAKAQEGERALLRIKVGFAALKRTIAVEFFPIVTFFGGKISGVIKFLQKWSAETNVAKVAAYALGAGVAAAGLKAAIAVARLVGALPTGVGFWKSVLGLGVWGLVLAAVILLGLGIEDLWTFMEGGDSVIGDLLTHFLGLDEATEFHKSLTDGWKALKDAFDDSAPSFKEVGKILLDIAIKAAPYVIATIELIVRAIGSAVVAIGTLMGAAVDFMNGKSMAQIGDKIYKGSEAIFGKKGLLGDNYFDTSGKPREPAAPRTPTFEDGPVRGGVKVVNQNNSVTNNITGVKDAPAAGQAAKNGTKDALRGELQNAFNAAATDG